MIYRLCASLAIVAAAATLTNSAWSDDRPNILFISVDDMSCDSVGVFGCKLEETTPSIDRLAAQGTRFEYAHVQVGNCMPCRNVLFSGRYPHSNLVEGFYQVKNPKYPVLCELMQAGGYFTAIRGKVSHSTPYTPFSWDLILDQIDGEKQHTKNIQSYYRSAKRGIEAADKADKPFCMLINVSDPHKPFYAMGKGQNVVDDPNVPSRVYTPDEVPVPGFLFDDADIRRELAHYYSSVRRADDCVGAALKALDESGKANSTVVVFLSDHGMPLPFAKTALYHHSTRTPWIVRWPDVVAADAHDEEHMISGVDLLPTLLDIAGIAHPEGLQGRSIVPLLKGQGQDGRDFVFKEYNENSGGHRNPMRGTQTKRFGYLFNPWVDGKRTFRTATTGTLAYRAMKKRAESDPNVAKRLQVFEYGEREQFFDYLNDPNALNNLINDPTYQDEINRHRAALEAWMARTGDHALTAFRNRDNESIVQSYMTDVEAQSAARRAARRKPERRARKQNVFSLQIPQSVSGDNITLRISYDLPKNLKTQKLHVTLKDADRKRVERKVVDIAGRGRVEISFRAKVTELGKAVWFAAFVGEDYEHHVHHVSAGPVPVADGD